MSDLDELIVEARKCAPGDDATELAVTVHRLADALESERDAALARIAELEQSLRIEALARRVNGTLLHEYERRCAEAAKLHQCFVAPNGFRWCSGCSTDEYPEEWPCPTAEALGLNEEEHDD